MASPIETLQAAGFSDDEITGWASERRGILTGAGFKDNEIDAYFAGSVVAPESVPRAFTDRFTDSTDVVDGLNKQGPNIAGRVLAAFQEGAAAGMGESPTGISPEDTKKLQDAGIFNKPDAGYDAATGIRFMNEAILRPTYNAVEAFFRLGNAAIYGVGAAAGQVIAEAGGANEAEQARARRDGAHFATVATLLASSQPIGRVKRSPSGEMTTEPIGTLPKGEDFLNSSRSVAGEEGPRYVQEKLVKSYEEQGLHPAEVAADAQTDPIVAQRLLSSDPLDMPHGGRPPAEPPKPPPPRDPPGPPPEGSFEAAEKKILDKISIGERAVEDRMTLAKVYRHTVDDLHPIKGVDADAYQLARLTRGQFGKAEHFLEHGTFDFNTYQTNGKPLATILDPVKNDLTGLRAYLASSRALEIEASGRKSGMDVEAAQRVIAEGEGKYGKIAGEVVEYQNKVLGYLRDSGVLSEKAFTAMEEAGRNYVPFYRLINPDQPKGAGSSLGPANPVKRLKGSDRDIIDPIESIIKNTYAYVSIAERNAAGIKLIDALKREGAEVKTSRAGKDPELVAYLKENGVTDPDALVDFVKAAPEEGDTIGAFRNGVKETVKVDDPELVAAYRGLDATSADMLTRVLAVPAKALRAGATLSPDFMVRNIVRDFLTAFVNTGKGVFSPIDTAKGLKSVITKDQDFLDWMKGGGANSTMVALDRAYLQESLQKLTVDAGLMDRSWNVVKTAGLGPVFRGLRMVSELAENATRLGEFKRLRGESKESIQAAAFGSREVTLDFARKGASMRAYNMITAFGNAQIQGLDRTVRQFKDRPTNTMLKVAGGITLPSVLLWFANKDDPRYKELPHWQKDLFWIVLTDDHIYRIPKPFEMGLIFGTGPERILDQTIGNNPEAFDKFGKAITEIIMPNFVPTAAAPLIDQWANRSTFTDRTLIPADQEKHLPEYQHTTYTTELTQKLGQMISAFPGMRATATGPGAPFGPMARAVTSPVLLENYIRSWTGGLGMYALQAADLSLRKTGVLPDPVKPASTLAELPVVKAFTIRYPSATAQSIQDFYDEHEVAKKFYDTWQAQAKEGDIEAAERIQAAGGPGMFIRLDGIKEVLGEHSKLIRDIHKNPDVKADEKRQLIDSLYFNMIEIGKAGKAMMREGRMAGEP